MSLDAPAPPPPDVRLPQSFTVREYTPDGGISFGGALQLVGFLGLAGIILGAIASFVSRFFYMVILFPIAIGLCVGWVGKRCITAFRIRRPRTCGVAGFIAGCLAMLSMHHFDYQHWQSTLEADVAAAGAELTSLQAVARDADRIKSDPSAIPEGDRADVLEFIAELDDNPELRRALLVDSVWSYIDFAAHQGVELKRGGGGGNGVNLGYVGSYIYWGIEALIVAGVAFGVMAGQAGQPFCSACDAWKVGQTLGPLSQPTHVRAALDDGVLNLFTLDPADTGDKVQVTLFRCPHCDDAGDVDVRLEQLTLNSKGELQTKQILQVTYPGDAYEALVAACSPTPLIAAPVPGADASAPPANPDDPA